MREKIPRLIELLAERESVALKIDYIKGKKQENEDKNLPELLDRMKILENEISSLTSVITATNIPFYLIGFEELVATEGLLSVSFEEKAAAIESKSGPLFEAIKKRLVILKKNREMKKELATVFHLLLSLDNDEIKQQILDAIKSGKPLKRPLPPGDERIKHLSSLLSRFGLYNNASQKKYVVSRDIIWLEGEEAKKMDGILAELAKLEPDLQWKNAQRQIKCFNEDEEKEFAEVQKKYLELLNLRDQIIQEYKKKEEALNYF